jgi:hypothetical protein
MKFDAMIDEGQKEAFQAMFGENLSVPVGFVGNYAVLGVGKDPLGQVQKIMDLLESGEEAALKYPPSTYGFPEENNLFLYFSLPKLMKWGMSWAAPFAPAGQDFEVQESPGIGMAARFVESRLEGQLFVPVEEILAIRNIFQMVPQGPREVPQTLPEEAQPESPPAEAQPETQPEEGVQPPAF